MTHKHASKIWAGLIVVAIGVSGIVYTSVHGDTPPPDTHSTTTAVTTVEAPPKASSATSNSPTDNAGEPANIHIPSLGINAPVTAVGVTKQGDMAAPTDGGTVGWYKHGALPGKPGNAVLAGHLNIKGKPAVFINLEKLAIGEKIIITDVGGNKLTFVATDKQAFKPETAPLERIFGDSDEARLNIITCEGTWHKETNSYSERLVVFTKRAE